jgi:DNA-binding CsgD family transcriptional regulator
VDEAREDAAVWVGSAGLASELWPLLADEPRDGEQAHRALRERVKELNCLYGVAQLVERHRDSMEGLFADLVDFLPLSWQQPESTCTRVTFEDKTFRSRNFRQTRWKQSAQIHVKNRLAGALEVYSLKGTDGRGQGPFLEEEALMLEEVAKRVGGAAARLETERALQEANRQLTIEHAALQEANSALRVVLARIEEEKQQIGRDVQANIQKVVLPIVDAVALELPVTKRAYTDFLRKSLLEVTSPFGARLSQQHSALTPIETTICNLIRSGLSSKEIAKLRGVSVSTVLRHREHIRRKLNLHHLKVNLTAYLQSMQ